MILVILGAGASYDSCPSRPPGAFPRSSEPFRPPLAAELFLDSAIVRDALSRFPECHPLVPYLQNIPAETTLEHVLDGLQGEAAADPERHRQLAAIRFYLQYVISDYEERWKTITQGMTNYVTLLDQLRRCRGDEPVCLVTFNYDRLLETALQSLGIAMRTLPDYISREDFQLFKLHGSVHWGREVHTAINAARGAWDMLRELIQRAAEIEVSGTFRMVDGQPVSKLDKVALFPAIAIPVETKSGFECPAEHLTTLKNQLPQVSKAILIGWRGTEQHFLQFFKEHVRHEIPMCAVARDRQEAEEVLARLRASGLKVAAAPSHFAFTEFVVRRGAESFLRS